MFGLEKYYSAYHVLFGVGHVFSVFVFPILSCSLLLAVNCRLSQTT